MGWNGILSLALFAFANWETVAEQLSLQNANPACETELFPKKRGISSALPFAVYRAAGSPSKSGGYIVRVLVTSRRHGEIESEIIVCTEVAAKAGDLIRLGGNKTTRERDESKGGEIIEEVTCLIKIKELREGKLRLEVGTVVERIEKPRSGDRETRSNRSRAVEGVGLDEPVIIDLGKDENTAWSTRFTLRVTADDKKGVGTQESGAGQQPAVPLPPKLPESDR